MSDVTLYRARIGRVHAAKSAALHRKLSFLDQSTFIPFFILLYSNNSDPLLLATLVYFCLNSNIEDMCVTPADNTKQNSRNKNSTTGDRPAKQNKILFSSYNNMLLFRSADVELNPGPPVQRGLCVVYVNARSLRNKLDLFEAESEHFDIITISETWLSENDNNNELHLTNFHPPFRPPRWPCG